MATKFFLSRHKAKLLLIGCLNFSPVWAQSSICYGSTADGRLENGVRLPGSGKNFLAYGSIPILAGRTFVHDKVRDVVLAAYTELYRQAPKKVFKYAECGFKNGGRFKPHKTHRNGLSVDFTVPVIDAGGRSVHLPTHVFNRFGYDIEFDKTGRFSNYRIDFEALGAHIVALHKMAEKQGVGIWRVLFAPDLQPYLFQSTYGAYIRKHVKIPAKRSWVRHDDHYHVDFQVPCRPLH